MEGNKTVEETTSELHRLFVKLASMCLREKPDDVERCCLEWLAKRQGMKLENTVALTRGHSVANDDDISEFVNDIETAQASASPMPTGRSKKSSGALDYDSSDEEEVRSIGSYPWNCDGVEEEHVGVRTTRVSSREETDMEHHQECYLFSTGHISDGELADKTAKYAADGRMERLFRAWDGDDSGAVDFVELVLALHKFEKVAQAGIDIQVASDALVQFVESATERELNLREFTRVVILFAWNNFHRDFDEVADHMLAVARGTSETAVLRAASGADVSELQAADKAEAEFLRATALGMEADVTKNIERIRTKRVQFLKGMSSK